MASLKTLFSDPAMSALELGSKESFAAQREAISRRRLTKATYDCWYDRMLGDVSSVCAEGPVLEIGSGANYAKLVSPEIITSDVVAGASDMVVDAQCLPFDDRSLKAIMLTHVFHHIPCPAKFLGEAVRTLVPGGVISIIDVAHTPFARFVFGRFHPEAYDSTATDWLLDTTGVYGGANQAMSWIVFVRDRARLQKEFPTLSVEIVEYLPWFGYLLSGGVMMRNFVPEVAVAPIRAADLAMTALHPLMALHWHMRIRHNDKAGSADR
jgi:SAM-dependent methyltransferase